MWRSSTDLLHAETGTRVDLRVMPPEGVLCCRAASLDLALPGNAADLDDDDYDIAVQARAAWEAAVCGDPTGTDDFALQRLAEVRPT